VGHAKRLCGYGRKLHYCLLSHPVQLYYWGFPTKEFVTRGARRAMWLFDWAPGHCVQQRIAGRLVVGDLVRRRVVDQSAPARKVAIELFLMGIYFRQNERLPKVSSE